MEHYMVGAHAHCMLAGHAGRDIHNLLRGLLQLCTVFQELSIVAGALAILQTATAAAVWPLVTLPVAIVSVIITALRVITWHHPQASSGPHWFT